MLLATLVFCAQGRAASMPTRVPDERPVAVPADYVATPNGYFHPSCVNEVAAGEVLTSGGRVRRSDGRYRTLAPCRYPHFSKQGQQIEPGESAAYSGPAPFENTAASTPPPSLNGYLVAGYFIDSSHPPSRLAANMTVPTAPTDPQDQIIYLFPGLVDYENEQTILQPVLGWNGFGDHAWTVASWNCCVDGSTNHSAPVAVNAGDVIAGTMSGTNCSANICANWSIVSADQTSGGSTTLTTTAAGQRFDWVFGAALEAYGISTCAQLPGGGSASFENIDARDMSGVNSYGTYPWTAWFPASVIFIDGFERATGNCPYELQFYGTPPASSLRVSWSK